MRCYCFVPTVQLMLRYSFRSSFSFPALTTFGAVVAVVPASDCSLSSNVVKRHVLTMWFIVCCRLHWQSHDSNMQRFLFFRINEIQCQHNTNRKQKSSTKESSDSDIKNFRCSSLLSVKLWLWKQYMWHSPGGSWILWIRIRKYTCIAH